MQKKLTHLLIIAFFLLSSLLIPHQAHACSCFFPYVWAGWEQSEAIFMGTVMDIQYLPPAPIYSSGDPITYTFNIHAVYKYSDLSPVKVQSARETDSCGAGLEIGQTYVVYTFRYEDGLWVNLCSHTHPADTLQRYRYDILMVIRDLRDELGFKLRSLDTIYWDY